MEGDVGFVERAHDVKISIHALRVEGDLKVQQVLNKLLHFYPRPPGGGRHLSFVDTPSGRDFYPRPPGGGRPREAGTN